MDPATLTLLVQLAAQLLALAKREIDLAQAAGKIPPELLVRIRLEAARADDRWDQLMKAAAAPGTPAPAPGTT